MTTENIATKKCTVEPIRGSVFILAIKFVLLILIFNGLYAVAYFLLNLGFPLPFNLHYYLAIVFLVLFAVNIAFQTYVVLLVSLQWANNVYYLTDTELVKRKGIINIHEETYKFDSIRSLSINRPLFGKVFGYADLSITVVSRGEEKDLLIVGISNPYKYEKMLRECCKKLVING